MYTERSVNCFYVFTGLWYRVIKTYMIYVIFTASCMICFEGILTVLSRLSRVKIFPVKL